MLRAAGLITILCVTLTAQIGHARQDTVPPAVAVDREENGHVWRRYFHEVSGRDFRFRAPSRAEWHFIWSAFDLPPSLPISVRYECQLDEEGRYIGSPDCRSRCPGAVNERACREAGQRYFDRARDDYPDMPEDHDLERAKRRYVAFQLELDPAMRPAIDFDQGAEAQFTQIVRNYELVTGLARRLFPARLHHEAFVTAQCKILIDRSVACRPIAISPGSSSEFFNGVAEEFALFANPVRRLADGGDPVGMRFSMTIRFKPSDDEPELAW